MILAVDDHQQCDTHDNTAAVPSQLIMIYRQPIDDHRMEWALSLTTRSDMQLLAETSENGHLLFFMFPLVGASYSLAMESRLVR